jgi:3-phosphoshikimate 1-carboxyvinyltransferase
MRIPIDFTAPSSVTVHGQGLNGLNPPKDTIDAGNSGTTARLLLGLLSGQKFQSSITGDASLLRRPMKRVTAPLRLMNASIEGQGDGGYLPLHIKQSSLSGIEYYLPVASAQVKSALMLATLYADSPSVLYEPALSRNHTEAMLKSFGASVEVSGNKITVSPVKELYAQNLDVPGDISSAAFFLTAGLLVPNSSLTIKQVGINPTRTGIIDAYRQMGADILIENETSSGGELKGDITVKSSSLKAITIEGSMIPRLIDEIPVIALAATQAIGTTIIRDAQELKVKESDRIGTVVSMLKAFGANIEATDDGMIIYGQAALKGTTIDSLMDHRIAMTAAIAGLIACGETTITGWEWVKTSFPNFYETIKKLEH